MTFACVELLNYSRGAYKYSLLKCVASYYKGYIKINPAFETENGKSKLTHSEHLKDGCKLLNYHLG
jgi:hypothetical protein